MLPYNETAVLRAVANGSEAAFREIVLHYQDVIYSAAFRLTRNTAMAEDILQDTFMKVWLKRDTLITIDNFGGWIYRIAQNEILNALKKIGIRAKVNERFAVADVPDRDLPSDTVDLKDLESIINKAIQNLPRKQEQAYILIKVKGMTREEASRVLGVSPETVKSNLDHAIRFIRAFCMRNLEHGFMFFIFYIFF